MGMGEIKENEATVNEITLENVEEQPVVYKEYSTEYLVSAVEAILFSIGESVSVDRLAKALEMETKKLSKQMKRCWKFIISLTGALRWLSLKMHISCVPEMSTTMC